MINLNLRLLNLGYVLNVLSVRSDKILRNWTVSVLGNFSTSELTHIISMTVPALMPPEPPPPPDGGGPPEHPSAQQHLDVNVNVYGIGSFDLD